MTLHKTLFDSNKARQEVLDLHLIQKLNLMENSPGCLKCTKNYHYSMQNGTENDDMLFVFFTYESIGGIGGAGSWLNFADDSTDEFTYGGMCMAFRVGNKICIKPLAHERVVEEGDTCMTEKSFRRLLLQMERAYIEMPEEIAINWHEDGSAMFDWKSICIRNLLLKREGENYYGLIQNAEVLPQDLFAIDILNLLLRSVFSEVSPVKSVVCWLEAYIKRGKSCELEGIHFEKIENEVIISRVVSHSNSTQTEKIVTTCFLASMMISHAVRIIEEKPTQVLLKWYEHGFAFEWERDGDV